MGRDTVFFASDMHLGACYMPDRRAHEARVAAFLRAAGERASDLILAGDILDYWYEYKTVVPRGYVRFFGELAALADSGVRVTWLLGNHDIWLFDYLRDEIGIEVADGPIVRDYGGKRFFISHGDGLGRTDISFRIMRSAFRNRFCQKLYAAIHPRWTVPFAHKWSSGSRGYAPDAPARWEGRMQSDVRRWAEEYASAHPDIDYIVLGHHHVVVDEPAGPDCRLIVLGDWIHNDSYATFDGHSVELHRFRQ